MTIWKKCFDRKEGMGGGTCCVICPKFNYTYHVKPRVVVTPMGCCVTCANWTGSSCQTRRSTWGKNRCNNDHYSCALGLWSVSYLFHNSVFLILSMTLVMHFFLSYSLFYAELWLFIFYSRCVHAWLPTIQYKVTFTVTVTSSSRSWPTCLAPYHTRSFVLWHSTRMYEGHW